MRRTPVLILLAVCVSAAMAALPAASAAAPPPKNVEQAVLNQLASGDSATFYVYLKEKADLSAASRKRGDGRVSHVYGKLTKTAARSQASLRRSLKAQQVPHESFWISNAVKATGDRALVDKLAARPDVSHIGAARAYPVPVPMPGKDRSTIKAPEWGLTNIRAPEVWSGFGVKGEGIVVANIDTGVEYNHPAVVSQYRGNSGGSFDHNYNWFDPTNQCGTTPCDNNNHGTHTMGTMIGDDGAGNQVGVAPGAKWIAAKGCASSQCSSDSLLRSGQWVMAPTDSSGQNAKPELHADIVNNSWGGGRGDTWYRDTINNWIAAGMFPAFANGNAGAQGCGSANSPGDNIEAYSAGAYDSGNNLASFSSRGPSGISSSELKPNIAAPGVSVRSSVRGGGYSSLSGTSMATPHMAGVVALVWSGAGSFKGDVSGTRSILDTTARDVNATGCGGTAADNNMFGEGRIDAFAAVEKARGGGGNQPPRASFTHSCDDPSLTCSFDGSASSDSDGSVDSYAWDFGDGSSGAGAKPSHTYASAGTYTVRLTVTDDRGAPGGTSKEIQVGEPPANQKPAAAFTGTCYSFFRLCIFDGAGSSDPDGTIASWSWNFGDNSTGSGSTAFHFYTAAGTYSVQLTVTDDKGATGSVTKQITVT